MILKLFLALLTFTLSAPIYAQIVDIEVLSYGGIVDPDVRAAIDDAVADAEANVNEDLPSGAPDRMMKGMANSSVMAGKGIGTDYASNMSVFLIGAGAGVAVDLEKPEGSDSKASGIGVAPGVVVGFNLGFMDTQKILGMETNRLNLYFNFMNYSFKKEFENKDGNNTELDVDMLAFGTHMRYDWVKGKGNKILGWGGVKFTFGFEYNKTNFDVKSDINKHVEIDVDGTNEHIEGDVTGTPIANILASTMSIPVALSTDIQILYFVSLYTGLGMDYNMGEAKGKSKLDGDPSTLVCTGGVACGGGQNIQVQAKANIDVTEKVDPLLYRAFAGVQLNLPWTRVFVQVDKSLSNQLIAATAGLRFAF